MINQFKSAKSAAVPILGIETFDPQQTIRSIAKGINGDNPLMQWDGIRGLSALNKPAQPVVRQICGDQEPAIATGNPAEMLSKIGVVPDNSLIFMLNAQRFIDNEFVMQGIWNLRDNFKSKGAMLILLGPSMRLPTELQQDVVVISEPLPSQPEIEEIVKSVSKDAGMEIPKAKELNKITDTLVGLSAFSAEQTLAMCIRKEKDKIIVDKKSLWDRKCKQIEQTRGLSIWKGGETFGGVYGCKNVKELLTDTLTSDRKNYRAIVWMDEIEKSLAGNVGDTSGVSQDQLGVILREMQDSEVFGLMFIGPPGAAKSMVAKAAGNTFNIPTIAFDFGAMKDPLVGKSGELIRTGFKVVQAISQGNALFIATCNSLANLPTALQRRFSLIFFFDLMSAEERQICWEGYKKKYKLTEEQCDSVKDTDWTGAEIKKCCDLAWLLNCKLSDASKFIVPIAKSNFEQIEALRKQASGKFISASYEGFYEMKMTDSVHESHRAL